MARVIVIGAGIAGMAAAIGLRRINLETFIIEQASELGEVGSGISLWPNALKALASLGIDGPVRRLAIEEGSGGIRSWRGRLLFQLDLQELRRELGDVTVILHRGELLSTLRGPSSRFRHTLGRPPNATAFVVAQRAGSVLESALYHRLQLNALRRLAEFAP